MSLPIYPISFPNLIGSGLALYGSAASRRKGRIPQYGSRPQNQVTGQRVSNRGRRRRFGRNTFQYGRSNGVEINRAEGGFKNINDGNRLMKQSVDVYREIICTGLQSETSGVYQFLESGSANMTLDLSSALNASDEFTTIRTLSTMYKLTGVRLSFDFSRILPSGTMLTKMVLTPQTDLIEIGEPLLNKNSMKLAMDRNGVKNFWFNLNKGNMHEDNVDWIKSTSPFEGTLLMHISSQGTNVVSFYENLTVLGILKISYLISYKMLDMGTIQNRVKKVIQQAPSLGKVFLKQSHDEIMHTNFVRVESNDLNTSKSPVASSISQVEKDVEEDPKDET